MRLAALAIGSCLISGALPAGEGSKAVVPNAWKRIAAGVPVWRNGGALVFVPGKKQSLFLGGPLANPKKKSSAYIHALDSSSLEWNAYGDNRPGIDIYPLYRAAYSPADNRIYCLSQLQAGAGHERGGRYLLAEGQLHSLGVDTKTWKTHAPEPLLKNMDWHTMALDSANGQLVVVGADKQPDNVGWSRTVVYDIESGKWRLLQPPKASVVEEHQALVAAKEALVELIGRTRLAWYRDPKGVGTETELTALGKRSTALSRMPGMARFKDRLESYDKLISARKTLHALKFARELQQKIELHADAQYPVPPSRQNSPIVYDRKNRVFVLFGGDHQDYLTNDTWALDLKKGWRRTSPDKAPSPRAGHALAYLPRSGKLLLYGGYLQSSDVNPARPTLKAVTPHQAWLYDVATSRWDLLLKWTSRTGGANAPQCYGSVYDYRAKYSAPLLAVDDNDSVYLATKDATWKLTADPARCDKANREKLAVFPNQRLYRTGIFRAAYCEVADPPAPTNLSSLPVNKFVKLPDPPKNVCFFSRSRVWSTAVWDPDRDQILMWGGGHCVRSESSPIHYSPISGRMVEGYDAQESYSKAGYYGATTMNRPWVGGHSWNKYAYDAANKLMMTDAGYRYDPSRMDWLRSGPAKPPYVPAQNTYLEGSRHGVVAWVGTGTATSGLWLFGAKGEWTELVKPGGTISPPATDFTGMVYDSKRDRMLLVENKRKQNSKGNLTAFYFEDRRVEKLKPANVGLGNTRRNREMVYVEHADWVLFGEPYIVGKPKVGQNIKEEKSTKLYLRAYDCAGNRWLRLDISGFPTGHLASQGWMYDAKRRLVYVANSNRWGVWALRLDPKTVKILAQKP